MNLKLIKNSLYLYYLNNIFYLKKIKDNVRTEKDKNSLAEKLIKTNLNEPLDFHLQNFRLNKINWKRIKSKIFYTL